LAGTADLLGGRPATLHELLQIAFDWSDFHLHRFVIRGKEHGLSRIGGSTFRTDAMKALLSQFHFRVNERFLYEYDFGDLWQHQIRFEGIEPSAKKSSTRFALVGLAHHRPKIAVGRKPTWRRWTITAGIHLVWGSGSPNASNAIPA
jgi:hypothetical protein